MKTTILLFGILISNFLFADGPPMDTTGKIRAKYIAIKLEANQINHLQVCRWLQLTTAQKQRLHFLNLPQYISITSPFYRDCTCGMIYAMWFRVDSIAFRIYDTTKTVVWDENDEIWTWYGKGFNNAYSKEHIYIGTTGQLFYMGKQIDIKDIPQIIEDLKPYDDGYRLIGFIQPPITNNPNALFVLRMKKELKKLKFEKCSIYWG